VSIENAFYEFAVLMAIAAVLGFTAHVLKQPLIIAFIAVGILVGPSGLTWVTIGSEIELLSKMGITLLLFTVGLRLDLNVIRTMGAVSLATGLGQVLFTSGIGYLICLALGLSHVSSVYVATALTFSSTIIIVKLLSDKRELDSLHGRIAVGFLIVQDLVVIAVMITIAAFGGETGGGSWPRDLAITGLKAGALLIFLGTMARYVLPPFFHWTARSPEVLTAMAIAWAVVLAAACEAAGLSKEVGAFLAGVALASMAQRDALASRLVGLRDFLLLFFFIDLGALFNFEVLIPQLIPALILSAFVLLGNPLIVMTIMGVMGYRKRTGFLAGLTVAQISEFSMMLAVLGVSLGHIGEEVLGLVTIVGLVTITLSTYMIIYSHPIYERIGPAFRWFERKRPFREIDLETTAQTAGGFDYIVFGLGRFGNRIAHELVGRNARVLGVDFDPDLVKRLRKSGRSVVYGDADDPEFASTLPLNNTQWVVSSIPHLGTNLSLVESLVRHGFSGKIAATAHHADDAARLAEAGCDFVLLPFADAAKESVDRLTCTADPSPPAA
jgi:Kef-type K+ transport system membrane component KefB